MNHFFVLCVYLCASVCVCVGALSGEVPGLYTPEELEPLLTTLKDSASQDGFTGPLYNYFSYSQYIVYLSVYLQYLFLSVSHSISRSIGLCPSIVPSTVFLLHHLSFLTTSVLDYICHFTYRFI